MLNRTTYSGLSYILAPVALARLYALSGKHPGYRQNIRQRFGFGHFERQEQRPLWLHAVSVGEVIASEPFVRALQKRYPQLPICLTTTTPTGAEQVVRSFDDAVYHRYAPYDLPGAVRRFVDGLNPIGLVIMETELWPNWIAEVSGKRALPSMLVNARLSEKSAKGYHKLGALVGHMLGQMSLISAQTERDASRFRALGADRVEVNGNLKADFKLDDSVKAQSRELATSLGLPEPESCIIAASTHPGEDELILDAFRGLLKTQPELRLLLVPRHPERAVDIGKLLEARNLGYVLRSDNRPCLEAPVVLCDLLGELRALYGMAQIALMGGTLVDQGGHNPLEPAAWGAALLAGPSQRNFNQSFSSLEVSGAMMRVESKSASIQQALERLIADPQKVRKMGRSAQQYLEESRGATAKTVACFDQLFDCQISRCNP